MPYVADVYQLPPGTAGVPNTTIESAKYNTFISDIATAQNTARPVVGGGTGGVTAVAGNDGLNTQGADIASGATTNLAAATGVYVNITGTTTITSFGTVAAGSERVLTFTGILTLTHNATSLILPGAANITTAVGDVGTFRSLGGGNWRCVAYLRANGGIPSNSISGTTILLKQSAAPTPTAEGDIQWDTDDNVVMVGDGAAAKTFVPIPSSTAAGDLEYFTAALVKSRLAKGTAGQVLRMNAAATAPEWGGGNGAPDAVMEDQKASATAGGTFTSGAWQTRDLNTEVRDASTLVSIAANAFTPTVAGWVEWSAPASNVGQHKTRLFNVTDTTVAGVGSSEQSAGSADTQTRSVGGAPVVAGKAYRIEHQCTTTIATNGFGRASGFASTVEVYARVQFWRTA